MLDRLHAERNSNRTHVCMQSRSDPYRVFKYDVVTAFYESNRTQPLLLSRHNAVPGMFLVSDIRCSIIFRDFGQYKVSHVFQMNIFVCKIDVEALTYVL